MSAQQVAADLRAAAEVLRRDGWTQEKFTAANGCHCAAGAMRMVAEDADQWRDAIDALCDSLGMAPFPIAIYRWNDTPGRTADEVIAALEAAAEAAEAQQ